MMRTPDGHGRVELTKFHTPPAVEAEPELAPANALGIRRIMFAVDDIDDVVARLRGHGAELVGEIAQYEDIYRLCFLRGPEGIIIGLAEQLSVCIETRGAAAPPAGGSRPKDDTRSTAAVPQAALRRPLYGERFSMERTWRRANQACAAPVLGVV
jgi:hypothetical protein